MAGLQAVPVVIRSIADNQALAVALIENIQREDLNPLEEAQGIQRLTNEFGLTHQSAAEALGRSRTAVTNLLRLLELAPPVRDLLGESRLDMGHARALLVLPALKQVELANEIAAKGLTVREVEKRVGELASRPKPRMPRAVDRDVARLEEELAQTLGTTVQLKQKGQGRGLLIVEYRNLDQLDALMDTAAVGLATFQPEAGWLKAHRKGSPFKTGSKQPVGSLQGINREIVEPASLPEFERLQRALKRGDAMHHLIGNTLMIALRGSIAS